MAENDTKNVLLNTYMHELPLSKRTLRRFDPKRALTLLEFMKLNPFIRYRNGRFIGPGKHEYCFFHKGSLMWNELKNFLLDSGFTSRDWGVLIPDENDDRIADLLLLSREQVLSLPIYMVSPGSSTSSKMFDVTVAELLKTEFTKYDKQTMKLQKILNDLGFNEEDGPYMGITKGDSRNKRLLKSKRNICTRSAYANFSLNV